MLRKIYKPIRSFNKLTFRIRPLAMLQLVIVWMLMVRDKFLGKKILILNVEELGQIQFIIPIVEILEKKKPSISFYIATEYIFFNKELAPLNVSKKKIFYPSICSWLWMADMFLSPSVFGKGPKRAIRVHISHNQPTKFECWPKEPLLNYDVHFLTGPLHREQLENMFRKYKMETKNIQMLNIGYPKSDALLQEVYNRDEVLDSLGLNLNNPTVVYAPAWDPGASLRSFGENVIEKLLTLRNINIIVKLHPVSYTPETSPNFEFYTGGINWIEKLLRFEEYPNFKHVAKYSIDPVLAASDVMVTDVSGVALEFIVLDRPVIYLDCPEYFEKTLKRPDWNSDPEYVRATGGRYVGIVVENLTELLDAIHRSLDKPDEFSEKRKAFSKRLLYNSGKGSEASADAIINLLKL